MANLTRYKQKIFANNSNQVGVFGTGVNKVASKDVETLQSADYEDGWSSAIVTSKNYPVWQERDGVDYGFSYQLAYLLQKGIPDWLSTETYYTNDFCKMGNVIYYSLQDDNIGKNPTTEPTYWNKFEQGANTDLSNLTNFGNARLQYAPFAINDGVVLNGENNTLTLPAGSSTTAEMTGTLPNYSGSHNATSNTSKTITHTFDEPKLLKDFTASYTLYPSSQGANAITVTAILTDDSEVQIASYHRSYSYAQYSDITYTFTTPTTVKAIKFELGFANVGSCSISNVSYTEIINVTAGEEIINSACTITTCDGRTKVFNDGTTYQISDEADGDYAIFKDFETGALSLVSRLLIGIQQGLPWTQPVLTANGTLGGDSFAVDASSYYSGSPEMPAWKAMDGTGSSSAYSRWQSTANPSWYVFYNPVPLKITNIQVMNGSSGGDSYVLATGSVEVSNDGTNWTLLKNITNSNGTAYSSWDINLSDNTGFYKYYRINCSTLISGDAWMVQEFTLTAIEYTENRLDTSTTPAKLYINGSLNNDLVYIGDCTVSSGLFTSVSNNQFNMNGYFEISNLPDFDKKVSISNGVAYYAEKNGWIVTSAQVIKPIYRGESYTPSSTGYYFAPMKGY